MLTASLPRPPWSVRCLPPGNLLWYSHLVIMEGARARVGHIPAARAPSLLLIQQRAVGHRTVINKGYLRVLGSMAKYAVSE